MLIGRRFVHMSSQPPWDNRAPVREELFSIERLEEHAQSLAVAQPVTSKPTNKQGITFRPLTEQMDTTTPQGEFLFHVFGALAQFERSLTQERVHARLASARRRGRGGGRPVAIEAEKLAAVVAALEAGASKAAVCRTFAIKRSTLIDSLARIGWSSSLTNHGGSGDATTATDRGPACRAVRSTHEPT
jgi:hypothetical protein